MHACSIPWQLMGRYVSRLCVRAILLIGLASPACEEMRAADSATAGPPPVPATSVAAVESSVVKVFATVRYPDPYRPWAKQSPEEQSGSGVVIRGKRLLTNAHVVGYASQVQIQANHAGDRIPAT